MTLLTLSLATWRISYMLVWEAGPWSLFIKVRQLFGIEHDEEGHPYSYPDTMPARLLSCVWCTSVWIAAAFAVSYYFYPTETLWACLPFALSAGAILIDNTIGGRNV